MNRIYFLIWVNTRHPSFVNVSVFKIVTSFYVNAVVFMTRFGIRLLLSHPLKGTCQIGEKVTAFGKRS